MIAIWPSSSASSKIVSDVYVYFQHPTFPSPGLLHPCETQAELPVYSSPSTFISVSLKPRTVPAPRLFSDYMYECQKAHKPFICPDDFTTFKEIKTYSLYKIPDGKTFN